MSVQSPQINEGSADDSPAQKSGCDEEEEEEQEEQEEVTERGNINDDDEVWKVQQGSQRRLHPRGHRRAKKEGRQEEECKSWDAPPPPEWLERHRQELWPTYDPSSYNWPRLLADLLHTPVRYVLFQSFFFFFFFFNPSRRRQLAVPKICFPPSCSLSRILLCQTRRDGPRSRCTPYTR